MRERIGVLDLQIKQLQKDRDRLDFWDKLNGGLNAHYGTTYRWELVTSQNVNRLMIKGVSQQHVDINDTAFRGFRSIRDVVDQKISDLALGKLS